MDEVATINFRIILRAAALRGVDPRDLVRDAQDADALLHGTKRFYAWPDYVSVMERFAHLVGGYEELAAVAESLPNELAETGLLEVLVAPELLYHFLYRTVNPRSFRGMRHACTSERDGRLRISHEIADDWVPCLAFGWATLGGLRALPRYVGLASSQVEFVDLSGHRVSYLVTPPPSQTLLARSRRALPAAARALWRSPPHASLPSLHRHEARPSIDGRLSLAQRRWGQLGTDTSPAGRAARSGERSQQRRSRAEFTLQPAHDRDAHDGAPGALRCAQPPVVGGRVLGRSVVRGHSWPRSARVECAR